MLMNYHQMAMNQPRDSLQQGRQMQVMTIIMVGAGLYSFTLAGGFNSLHIQENGTFPGGEFVFKLAQRDYTAAPSLAETVKEDAGLEADQTLDQIYTVFLDDPAVVTHGRQQRFAAGYLMPKNKSGPAPEKIQQDLLAKNEAMKPLTPEELADLPATTLWLRLPYQTYTLPTVPALVAEFPLNDGLMSALLFSWRVLPTLRQAATKRLLELYPNQTPNGVVLSTCSEAESMCTYYLPLAQLDQFLLGQPDMATYLQTVPTEPWFDARAVGVTLRKFVPWVKYFIPSGTPSEQKKKEQEL